MELLTRLHIGKAILDHNQDLQFMYIYFDLAEQQVVGDIHAPAAENSTPDTNARHTGRYEQGLQSRIFPPSALK